jgi:hypothetical protein
MSGDVQVGEQAITLGWRTAVALVGAVMVSSVTGTAYVVSRIAHIEAGLQACSTVPERLESLDDRVTALEYAVGALGR